MHLWFDQQTTDIAKNVAIDEAMITACESGWLDYSGILRFWEQRSWAVVLGASGRIEQEVYADRCEKMGIPIARRSSGGGTVLLGPGTFCLSWVRPLADFPTAQRDVRELQVQVLRELAEIFQTPQRKIETIASGDWSIKGLKCAGSAQRRQKTHVLIHVSVLNRTDLSMIPVVLPEPPRMPDYRLNRSHSDFVTNLNFDNTLIRNRLSEKFPKYNILETPPKNLLILANNLVEDRFGLGDWTYRF